MYLTRGRINFIKLKSKENEERLQKQNNCLKQMFADQISRQLLSQWVVRIGLDNIPSTSLFANEGWLSEKNRILFCC